MKTQLLALMTIFTLLTSGISFAQGGGMGKGMGKNHMSEGMGPGMNQERPMMKPQGEPLARINKFLQNPDISNETKEVIISEFKKFSEETFQLRLKHEEELYKWRKERMEKQHIARLEKLKEQNALKNSLNYSSLESLKEFTEKMKTYRETHRENMMEGKEEHRAEMDKLRDVFRKEMKSKGDDFRNKIKEIVKNARANK